MSDEILVTLQDAKKRYSGRLALACEQLEIRKGDCLAIEGGNGSGKSTLLRILARVTDIDGGEAKFTSTWTDARIVYYPQSGGMYGNLTVRENLNYYQRLLGTRGSLETARQFLSDEEFAQFLDTKVSKLSGGAQRLAGLRLALSVAADILILDEPAAELSHAYVDRLTNAIKTIQDQYLAIILAEHSQAVIAAAKRRMTLIAP